MTINDHIISWCKRKHKRTYHCVHADSKREARVLYDLRVFEPYPRETLGKVDLASLVAKVVSPMPELESKLGLDPETEADRTSVKTSEPLLGLISAELRPELCRYQTFSANI